MFSFLGIDVGQADVAFVVTPGRKKILIDGSRNDQVEGFLNWKYQLANANSDNLANVLLSIRSPMG